MGDPVIVNDLNWLSPPSMSESMGTEQGYYGTEPMQTEVYRQGTSQYQQGYYGAKPMQTEVYQQGTSRYQQGYYGAKPMQTDTY